MIKFVVAAALAVVLAVAAYFVLHGDRGLVAPSVPRPAIVAPAPLAVPQAAPLLGGEALLPADCLLPGPPPVPPDGAHANAADMALGHDAGQGFVVQLEHYQRCMDAKADHTPGASAEQKKAWIQQGDDAIDQANAVAAGFSEQLRIFNARKPAP